MSQVSRKPWYCVDITYETMGGEKKINRSKPMRSMGEAMRIVGEHRALGYEAELIEVPAPPTKRSVAPNKIGAHGDGEP